MGDKIIFPFLKKKTKQKVIRRIYNIEGIPCTNGAHGLHVVRTYTDSKLRHWHRFNLSFFFLKFYLQEGVFLVIFGRQEGGEGRYRQQNALNCRPFYTVHPQLQGRVTRTHEYRGARRCI